MLEGLIGAGLGAVGSVASSAMNIAEARRNRDWQERMANTAHQREVADLRAANLNPILGFSRGMGGADTPSPQQGKVENPLQDVSTNYSAAQGAALSKALNAAQLQDIAANIGLKQSQTKQMDAQTALTASQAILAAMDADPAKWAQGMRNMQATERVLASQAELNTSSAKNQLFQAQVRSPTDLMGKVLESSINNSGPYSIQSIVRRLFGTGEATGAGNPNPSGGRHSAKQR